MSSEPIQAGLRLASSRSRAAREGMRVYHVANWLADDTAVALCDPVGLLLLPESLIPAQEVFDDVRCKRPLCAAVWETVGSRRYGGAVREREA